VDVSRRHRLPSAQSPRGCIARAGRVSSITELSAKCTWSADPKLSLFFGKGDFVAGERQQQRRNNYDSGLLGGCKRETLGGI